MSGSLILTALLMGIAGAPHCVAMCGAGSAAVVHLARATQRGGVAALVPATVSAGLAFQAGRAASYAVAGAIVALASSALALAAGQVAALRPLWLLLHLVVLGWALTLMLAGAQPRWAHRIGQALSLRLRQRIRSPWGVFAGAALWVLLPCGLLYSALMLATLASGALEGALVMLAFALGGGAALWMAPRVWSHLRGRVDALRKDWGARIAGLLLALVSAQALWMDVAHQIELWCA